ncbi:MAG: DNA polymerase [Selenomonadales bacterium]|nr:DNA polymerase [Selenomonadales bacterium]
MKHLSVDIETFSDRDLSKCGVYKYAESPNFEILLFSYSADGGNVHVVDIVGGEKLPREIEKALVDESVTKWAFNAQFERVCLSRYLGHWLRPESWRCTMVWAAYLGLPLSLEGTGAVLGLEKQKLKEGKDLIRYFSVPCKPTKANGGRTRNLPSDAPDKWEQFRAYNVRDVETEQAIQARLHKFPVPEDEWLTYILDQYINDRGIQLDLDLVAQAIRFDERSRAELTKQMMKLTTLDNPNSIAQMKAWLAEHGMETDTLDKAAVKEMLKSAPHDLKQVLELRQSLAKSSVKKYTTMGNVVGNDGRARGLLQFYGANRTGRWAGRLIQVQNLPQNHLPDLAEARNLVKSGSFEMLDALYDSVPLVLSELIRTAFVPRPGYKFIVADFSAIEARVIAWLAGETWRNEVFATHGKIYEASASQMFQVPIEEITKGSPLRQKGKIAELALGYGGSVGALKAMGALEMGLAEHELQPLVNAWRSANPKIVRLWWDVDKAAMTAVNERTNTQTHGIRFEYRSGMLFIVLPSGRRLAYVKPKIGQNRFGGEAVTYEGVGISKKWERIESYGPKFVENIVQAISRDILCHAMRRLDAAGFSIVMSVHDEVVIEAPPEVSPDDVCRHMAETPSWAEGLLLRAEGFVCPFYKKD